jgi:nicotinate-nucleotide pyrophosphorylase (carboxylating)
MTSARREFATQTQTDSLRDDLTQLVRLAMREDLDRSFDLTTVAVVPHGLYAEASIVARVAGVTAGFELVDWILETINCSATCRLLYKDGQAFEADTALAVLQGEARDVLTCERTVLNFLGRLCGIATWTRQHVECVQGLPVRVYDTRKTTPGWRRLEKYAVHCGGGCNHRSGLYDAILIKDNHLACHFRSTGCLLSPQEAVRLARQFLNSQPGLSPDMIVEIEVDTLEQLAEVLPASPDIILLDNMSLDNLTAAVELRNRLNPSVELEASGGVNLKTLRSIAETGVNRISVGALTHSAVNLDLGLDWNFDVVPARFP